MVVDDKKGIKSISRKLAVFFLFLKTKKWNFNQTRYVDGVLELATLNGLDKNI